MAGQAGSTPESALDDAVAALRIPLGRAGTADDVAGLIAFLVSPRPRRLPDRQPVHRGRGRLPHRVNRAAV